MANETLPLAQQIAQAVALGAVAAPTDASGWQELVDNFHDGGPVPGTAPASLNPSPTGMAGASGTSATMPGASGDVNSFLAAIKQHESGGNYTAYNAGGGASGAYQFIQPTWTNAAKEAGYDAYANGPASAAPPQVQDAVAAHMATSYYQQYGSWADAAEAWYDPADVGKNVVPDPQAGNRETVTSYGQQIMSLMGQGSTSQPNAAPAANQGGSGAVNWASQQIGTRYVWGGEDPTTPGHPGAFDCLIAGTMVETIDGPRPIEMIEAGQLVLTRSGYRKVIRAWKVGRRQTINVGPLCGTPEHMVWTENRGWVELANLTKRDKIIRCEGVFTSLMVLRTTAIQTPVHRASDRTFSGLARRCIGRFGSLSTALLHLEARSITSMATRLTMPSRTFNGFRSRSTVGNRQTVGSSTTSFAQAAVNSSAPSPTGARSGASAPRIASRGRIGTRCIPKTLATLGPVADVYDLTVEGAHEFFANGVLVHNCSGLVQAAYKAEGINLPRVAQAQYNATTKLPAGAALQPGDLVFFGKGAQAISHVGIYIGNGQMIDAPHTGANVRTEAYQWGDYVGATRPTDPTGQSMLQPAAVTASSPGASSTPTREMNLGEYYKALNQVTDALSQHAATVGGPQ